MCRMHGEKWIEREREKPQRGGATSSPKERKRQQRPGDSDHSTMAVILRAHEQAVRWGPIFESILNQRDNAKATKQQIPPGGRQEKKTSIAARTAGRLQFPSTTWFTRAGYRCKHSRPQLRSATWSGQQECGTSATPGDATPQPRDHGRQQGRFTWTTRRWRTTRPRGGPTESGSRGLPERHERARAGLPQQKTARGHKGGPREQSRKNFFGDTVGALGTNYLATPNIGTKAAGGDRRVSTRRENHLAVAAGFPPLSRGALKYVEEAQEGEKERERVAILAQVGGEKPALSLLA